MFPIKFSFNILLLSTILFLTSCLNSVKKDGTDGDSPQVVNRLIANDINPVSFPSKTQSVVTLSYTSIDNEKASSCSLSQLSHVSVSQACSCSLGVCTVGVTGAAMYTGAASFAFNVVAGGKTSTTGKANFTITAPPAGSNQAPTISSIGAKTTSESVATTATFTVADTDSIVTCSNVTVASSNTTLIPVSSIVITGSGTNCTATISPAASQTGSSNITFTLTDTGSPLPAQTATSTFTVTVNPVNHAPTISTVGTQSTNEDTTTSAIAFTIADVDSTLSCSNVTATSSNTTLVANSNITIGGTAPNCTVTMSPSLNQSGTTSITLKVTDNGTPLPAKTTTTSFTLNVFAVNDAPVVSTIATQTTAENTAKNVSFTITDVDSTLTCNGSVVVSSSNTTLVPNTNISLSGIAPNCVATITPANGEWGTTTLTVTVSDNGFPLPVQTATTNFSFQVAEVNQPPTISAISAQATDEDTATGDIAFTIADSDSVVYCSNVTGTSSNTGVVSNANIIITGTAPNCVATITPTANGYGSTLITLTLTDNGAPLPAQSTSSFSLTVNAVNDAPTISSVSNQTTNEGSATSSIPFTINDVDSNLSCTSSVTAASSDTTIIPNANIVFAGTAPNCIMIITPAAAQYGTATITLTVTDNGTPLPAQTATTNFDVAVTQVNQAPTITTIAAQTTNEDTATGAIAFTIGDTDSTVYCSNVVGTSNNTALVPNTNIVITGTEPNCLVTVTPVADASGTANITLTLTDNGTPLPAKTATSSFTLTVNAVNDAPIISTVTDKSTDEDIAITNIPFTISDIDSTVSCTSSMSATSSDTTVIPVANITFSGTAPNCLATITPAADQFGSSTVTFTVTDNGTPMPAATASTTFNVSVASVPDLTGTLTVASNLSGVASSYSGNTYARKINFTGLNVDEPISDLEVCLGTTAGACDVSSWVSATGYTSSGSAPTVTLGGGYRMVSGVGGAQSFALSASCSSTTNYYYSIRVTNASSKVSNIMSTPAWSFWEPSCLGSSVLAQWLDASESSTITIATGVSNWTDKSGNGRTVSQGSGTRQPAFSSSALGTGLAGVTFNGSNNSLGRASFVYDQGATSIFTVIKAAASSGDYIFSEGNASNGTNVSYSPFMTSSTNTITGLTVNDANTAEINLPTTDTTIFDNTIRLGMIEDSGTTYFTYSNGTAQSQAQTTYTRDPSTVTTYRLGARFRNNSESGYMAGSIGEFIITNGVLSTLNRQKLEGYSAHKWGVSANLPGGHPYSTTPP